MKTHILLRGEKFPIDTGLTLQRVRNRCPGFFSMKPRGERVTVRKGFVVSSHLFCPTYGTPSRRRVLYVYNTDLDDTYHVISDCGSVRGVHLVIDWLLGELPHKPEAAARLDEKWEPLKGTHAQAA